MSTIHHRDRRAVEGASSTALASFGADAETSRATRPSRQLDIDSLDLVELAQIVEEEFGVRAQGRGHEATSRRSATRST